MLLARKLSFSRRGENAKKKESSTTASDGKSGRPTLTDTETASETQSDDPGSPSEPGANAPRLSSSYDPARAATPDPEEEARWDELIDGAVISNNVHGWLQKKHQHNKVVSIYSYEQWGRRYFTVDDSKGVLRYSKGPKQEANASIALCDITSLVVVSGNDGHWSFMGSVVYALLELAEAVFEGACFSPLLHFRH